MNRVMASFLLFVAGAAVSAPGAPPAANAAVAAAAQASVAGSMTVRDFARRAHTEGALVAMARACNVSKADLQKLVPKMKNDTLSLAKSVAVKFDGNAYAASAADGAATVGEVLAPLPLNSPDRERYCREAKDKVARRLAG